MYLRGRDDVLEFKNDRVCLYLRDDYRQLLERGDPALQHRAFRGRPVGLFLLPGDAFLVRTPASCELPRAAGPLSQLPLKNLSPVSAGRTFDRHDLRSRVLEGFFL